jgi:PHP family Zn ribbon phosphoesterase
MPMETINKNYLCPVCGKKVTVGVMHRVEKLADRDVGFRPSGAPDYYSIIPLAEIISETIGVGVNSKSVEKVYFKLLNDLGNEFQILLENAIDDIEVAGSTLLAEAISRVRAHKVHIAPGYDGEYGRIKIFDEIERKEVKGQKKLY